jgi:hypothetical protein
VYLQADDSSGNLTVQFAGDSTDKIIVHNDLTFSGGVMTTGINQLQFSDGSAVNLGQGSPLSFTWLGNSNNFGLTGSNYGSNVFDITALNGNVTFGNSSKGGDGKNTLKYVKGDGLIHTFLNGGTGAISFGANVSAQDVYLQATDSNGDLTVQFIGDTTDKIIVHNDLINNSWGVSSGITQLQFSDGSVVNLGQPASGQGAPLNFTWIGSPGGSASGSGFGANIFELGAGSESFTGGDKAHGGSGSNTYIATTSTGQATINRNEAAGTMNELDFTSGINDENLWFVQSGNNLKIDLLGTSTSVTVNGWFSSSSNQLQEITAGGLRIDSQISQLVQAMATYSAANSGFDPTNSSIHTVPNDTSLQNSVAAAWHA